MKPRLLSCPLTLEDFEIWDRLSEPRFREGAPFEDGVPLTGYCESHWRDVRIMHTRTHRAAFMCTVCWEFTAHPGCTIDHELRLRRPFPPNSLGALLRDALK